MNARRTEETERNRLMVGAARQEPSRPLQSQQCEREIINGEAQLMQLQQHKQKQQMHQSLQMVNESLSIARETVNQVNLQTESLHRSEQLLDDSQYMVERATHVVRGMTWGGWLYNKLVKTPQPTQQGIAPGDAHSEVVDMGFICPECRRKFRSPEQLTHHFESEHENESDGFRSESKPLPPQFKQQNRAFLTDRSLLPAAAAAAAAAPMLTTAGIANVPTSKPTKTITQASINQGGRTIDDQEQFLDSLQPHLSELKEISLALGNALEGHNSQLDRIDQKTDKTTDDMKLVTVKASRISNGTLNAVVFQFRCAFQEVDTGLFLQVLQGEPLVTSNVISENAIFRAFTVKNSPEIWGFQCEQSKYFLGLNRYGTLRVEGKKLRSYEQFTIEVSRPTTPLYSFASFFSSGGWVTRDARGKLSCIRGTATNKPLSCRFKLVKIDDKAREGQESD